MTDTLPSLKLAICCNASARRINSATAVFRRSLRGHPATSAARNGAFPSFLQTRHLRSPFAKKATMRSLFTIPKSDRRPARHPTDGCRESSPPQHRQGEREETIRAVANVGGSSPWSNVMPWSTRSRRFCEPPFFQGLIGNIAPVSGNLDTFKKFHRQTQGNRGRRWLPLPRSVKLT